MNGLDYVILAIIALCALSGLSRGALRMATSILALAFGIYAASVYYAQAAALANQYLKTNLAVSDVIGYVALFLIVYIAIEYAGNRLIRLIQIIHLNWIDRLAGADDGSAAVVSTRGWFFAWSRRSCLCVGLAGMIGGRACSCAAGGDGSARGGISTGAAAAA